MTAEELKKAIDILAGQGNQVDCGGQLRDVLKGILGLDYEFNGEGTTSYHGEMQMTDSELIALTAFPIMPIIEAATGYTYFGVPLALEYEQISSLVNMAKSELGLPASEETTFEFIWGSGVRFDGGSVDTGVFKVVFKSLATEKKYFCDLSF